MKINAVRYYRQHVHLTQQQLADLAGITQGAVRQIESGGGFSAETAFHLAKAFEQKGLGFDRILAEISNPETRTLTLVPEQQLTGDQAKF